MKKVIVVLIILLVLGFGIFVYTSFQKEQKISYENAKIIETNYAELTDNVNTYNEIRKELNNKLSSFFYDKFLKEKESYEEILSRYNDIIVKIDNNVSNIDSKCNIIYKNIEINRVCNSYKTTYEKLINIYVKDLINYNNKIKGYNEYKNAEEELYKMIHEDYIDYNSDSLYEGKSSNEEIEE